MLTVSIASPSAAAFLFSRALTLAVVDRTAVATFVIASFLGGFVDDGYAKRLGLAADTKSNLGSYNTGLISVTWVKSEKNIAYLEVSIKPNDTCGFERQRRAMCQRVPIPELTKHDHAYNRTRVLAASPTL